MLSPLAHMSPMPANTPTPSTNKGVYCTDLEVPGIEDHTGLRCRDWVRGMRLGSCKGQVGSPGHREDQGGGLQALPGAARTAPNACHSLSSLTLQAQIRRPGGTWQPEKCPNCPSGSRCSGARRPDSPSSPARQLHLPPAGGQRRQPLPTVARIPSSLQRLAAGRSRVQGGG